MESNRQERKVEDKILNKEQLGKELVRLRDEGKRIVFTNGCFDILHVGHASYLEKAKEFGDVLVLAINSDASVRTIKGGKRPLIPEEERAYMVASLEVVDYVTIFSEKTPLELIDYLMPNVLVKGGDWAEEKVVGRESVEKWGGKVVIIPEIEGASTTNIVEKIIKMYCNR